ncbi:MAG: phosphonate C-P lyase system protein PhnH [Chloroflexota bacterium]
MSPPTLTPRAAREHAAFRALLDGMARPGTLQPVAPHPSGGPSAHVVSLLESVLDHEVTFALEPDDAPLLDSALRYTGSRTATLEAADYVLARGTGVRRAISGAKQGELEYPDRSATILAQMDGISETETDGLRIQLRGPGIADQRTLWVRGLAIEDVQLLRERNANLPLGVDLVLVTDSGWLACVPRYTRIDC